MLPSDLGVHLTKNDSGLVGGIVKRVVQSLVSAVEVEVPVPFVIGTPLLAVQPDTVTFTLVVSEVAPPLAVSAGSKLMDPEMLEHDTMPLGAEPLFFLANAAPASRTVVSPTAIVRAAAPIMSFLLDFTVPPLGRTGTQQNVEPLCLVTDRTSRGTTSAV